MISRQPTARHPTGNQGSFLNILECSTCGKRFSPDQVQTYCADCQAALLARYDLETARERIDRDELRRRPSGMWRWHELLPVKDPLNFVYLGEGDTALLNLPNLGKSLGFASLLSLIHI